VAAASVIGPGHLVHNKPCQDAFSVEWLDDDRGLIVVADGAGSYTHSQMGANFVAAHLGRCTGEVRDVLLCGDSGPVKKTRRSRLQNACPAVYDQGARRPPRVTVFTIWVCPSRR